nr:hypothetical protein GCM10020092_081350 [Actinoplanes digitatis]
MLVFPVALVGLISGVAAVAHAQRVGDRKVLLGSLAAIAAWVVLLAVTLSPYGLAAAQLVARLTGGTVCQQDSAPNRTVPV